MRTAVYARIAIALGASLGAVAVGEIYLRATGFKPAVHASGRRDDPALQAPDPELGWRNAPGAYTLAGFTPDSDPIRIRVLPDGSRATAAEPVKRGPRVVLVGGSFTFGWALSDSDTLAWRVQAAHPGLRVQNFGSNGYGTVQCALTLRQLCAQDDPPRLVIYGFFDHHEERNVAPLHWLASLSSVGRLALPLATLDARGALVFAPPISYPDWLLSESSALITRLQELPQRRASDTRSAQRRAVTEALLMDMRDTCARAHATLIVTLLAGETASLGHYRAFCARQGIRTVDCALRLTPELRVSGEGHPNALANRQWSDAIESALHMELAALEAH